MSSREESGLAIRPLEQKLGSILFAVPTAKPCAWLSNNAEIQKHLTELVSMSICLSYE